MKMRIWVSLLSLLALTISSCKQKTAEPAMADTTAVNTEVTQMIIHASVFLKPEKVTDFIEAAKVIIDSSNLEPGCISYQLYQDPYNNTRFMFVETWKDQAAIDTHFAMPYFKAWGPKTQDWLSQPTELKIFTAAVKQ
jgi:quinol monooxygenase YgiN